MKPSRQVRRTTAPAALLATVAAVALTACGSSPTGSATSPPATSGPAASSTGPTASATDLPTASGSTSASVTPTAEPTSGAFGTAPVSGGTAYPGPAQAHLERIAVGSHTGYDRLVLYFGKDPVPTFTVTPQDTASFKADPSDQVVTLAGTSGIRVVVQSTVRANQTVEDLMPKYPAIRQVRNIGDFEAVVTYAVGVLGPAQVRVTTLTAPNRLVVDVAWPDPA